MLVLYSGLIALACMLGSRLLPSPHDQIIFDTGFTVLMFSLGALSAKSPS